MPCDSVTVPGMRADRVESSLAVSGLTPSPMSSSVSSLWRSYMHSAIFSPGSSSTIIPAGSVVMYPLSRSRLVA